MMYVCCMYVCLSVCMYVCAALVRNVDECMYVCVCCSRSKKSLTHYIPTVRRERCEMYVITPFTPHLPTTHTPHRDSRATDLTQEPSLTHCLNIIQLTKESCCQSTHAHALSHTQTQAYNITSHSRTPTHAQLDVIVALKLTCAE